MRSFFKLIGNEEDYVDVYLYNESKSELEARRNELEMQLKAYKKAYRECIEKVPNANFCNKMINVTEKMNFLCESCYFVNKNNGLSLEFNYLGEYQTKIELSETNNLLHAPSSSYGKYQALIETLYFIPKFYLIGKNEKIELKPVMAKNQVDERVKLFKVETFLSLCKEANFIDRRHEWITKEQKDLGKEMRMQINDWLVDIFERDQNSRKKKVRSVEYLNDQFKKFDIPLEFKGIDGKRVVDFISKEV
ncbi:MAG: hypothetical protein Q4C49_13885 [Bacillota bacterium]|nr:hypothetical protein [Bacillota bacterium]